MSPVIPGSLTKIDTTVNLANYATYVNGLDANTRMLHNKSQVVMAQFYGTGVDYVDNPSLRYWFLDGTEATSYAVTSGGSSMTHLLDMAYDGQNDQYYMLSVVTGTTSDTYNYTVFITDLEGNYTGTFIPEVDFNLAGNTDLDTTHSLNTLGSSIKLTVDNDATPNVYIAVTHIGDEESSVYKFLSTNSYPNTAISGSVAADTTVTIDYSLTGPTNTQSSSFSWSGYSGQDYLTYFNYNTILSKSYIKRINDDTLVGDSEQVSLDITDYDTGVADELHYQFFYNQLDFNTMYYIGSDGSLYEYNIDELLAAFLAVNVDDAIMPAGTGAQTTVTAEVINAYGDALTGKSVGFAVTAGLGAITGGTPVVTSGGGVATTVFQVGNNTGLATITATVTES